MAQELVWNQLVWNMGVLWVSCSINDVALVGFEEACVRTFSRHFRLWRSVWHECRKNEVPGFKPFRTLPLCLEPSRQWQEKWALMAGHLKW